MFSPAESPLLVPCALHHNDLWNLHSILFAQLNSSACLHRFKDNHTPLPPRGSKVEFEVHSFTEIALLGTQAVAESLDLMASRPPCLKHGRYWVLPAFPEGWGRQIHHRSGQGFPVSFPPPTPTARVAGKGECPGLLFVSAVPWGISSVFRASTVSPGQCSNPQPTALTFLCSSNPAFNCLFLVSSVSF